MMFSSGFRFLYTRSGEILTGIIFLALLVYLAVSLSGFHRILANENKARERVEEIHLLERKSQYAAAEGRYLRLSQIKNSSPLLESLEPLMAPKRDNEELLSDGNYLYFFCLDYKPHSAEDYISGKNDDRPLGFKVLAWPLHFAHTGELTFYIDQRGKLTLTPNKCAQYDGIKSYPPDLAPAMEAINLEGEENVFSSWIVDASL